MEGVDPDSAAYRFGEVMFDVGMIGVALWLVIWGFLQRTGPKKYAGQIKMAIGGGLAMLTLLGGLAQVVAPNETAADRKAAERQSLTKAVEVAHDYLESRRYVRVRGVTAAGEKLDITYVGDESTGSMKLPEDGGSFLLRRVSGRIFMKPSRAFWDAQGGDVDPAAVIDFLDGRWIELEKGDDGFKDLAYSTQRDWLLKALGTTVGLRKGTPKTIHGVECIAVRRGAIGGTLYLARDDFRLIRFIDTAGEIDDLSYDRPVADPEAPSRVIAASEIY